MPDFVHLHTHSHYSLLDSCCRIPDLIKAAREDGMKALALTDYGNLFGIPEFYSEAKAAGIKPVIGMEAYLTTDRLAKSKTLYHLVLYAANRQGYENLMALSSQSYLDGFYYRPRIDRELLRRHAEGLIATSSCLKGEIPQRLMHGKYESARKLTGEYLELFNGRFYIEIQRHGLAIEKKINRGLIRLAKDLNLPLVAANDVHYIKSADAGSHGILLCIQSQRTAGDPHRPRYPNDTFYFRTAEEMKKLFRDIPSAVENTIALAEQCDVDLEFGKMHLPKFEVPHGFSSQQEFLKHLAFEGLRKKYPEPVPDEVVQRLNYELNVIEKMDFPGYFLVVQDFINAARRMGIGVGPGRGSAAGSLVSYVIGITNIDPIRYQLLFERFLNPDRISMPDIDIDFDDKKRGQVIEYVIEKYGKDNVTQVITFNTMAARGVIRDVARALEIPLTEADRTAKLISSRPGTQLSDAIAQNEELKAMEKENKTVHGDLIRHGLALEGLVRQPGIHAAGVVITPRPIRELIPIYKSAKNEIATQYDKDWIEKFGLLKMDFLGLTTLSILDEAVRRIGENHGVEIDLDRIPLDDPSVYKLFGDGHTIGIFQFESQGMTEYMKQLKPTHIEDLIAMNALYRPGPMGEIPKYIARKHGREPIVYAHPDLEPILKNTYGVIVYQEQVMLIAQALAGFTMGKADYLRKVMGKKMVDKMKELEPEWMNGLQQRGYPKDLALYLWQQITKFGEYAFNKSHSAAYAIVAYQTAYLKAHYPVEFMASALSAEMADTDRIAVLINACKDMDIRILPPDVNESEAGFTVNENAIRFGLAAVKNVGYGAIKSIVQARASAGRFHTLLDLCGRVDLRLVNKKVMESLVMSGACDSLQGNRAQKYAVIEDILQLASKIQDKIKSQQVDIFGHPLQSDHSAMNAVFELPPVPSWTRSDELAKEKELMGFYASGHPLDKYRFDISAFTTYQPGDPDPSENAPVTVGGMISDLRSIFDKKGKPMAFVSLQGFQGTVEIVVFAGVMKEVSELIKKEQVILVQGKISKRNESVSVIADSVMPLDQAYESFIKKILLSIDYEQCTEKTIADIDALFARFSQAYGNGKNGKSAEWFVVVELADGLGKAKYRINKFNVPPTRELIGELQKLIGQEAVTILTM